MINKYLRY